MNNVVCFVKRHGAGGAALAGFWLLALTLAPVQLLAASQATSDGIDSKKEFRALAKPAPGKLENLSGVFRKATPVALDDLKAIEKHIRNLAARVSPAVVAVRVGNGTGSGVVISEDGIVLSAAHVCVRPDENVLFTFPDGKTAKGKTLGTNHEIDAGLMQITDQGQWPHVQIGELDHSRIGDWVLALGHPGGFDPMRPTVVRLGRIIRLASNALQTDCTLIAGDSGGPLFDMHGRVVGIHSRISESTADNFHVPIATYHETWERLAKGENWGDQTPPQQPWVGAWGLDHAGALRLELVYTGSPAKKAGLKVGDVVMKVNGHEVKDYAGFQKYVDRSKPSDKLEILIKRDDSEMTVSVTVEPLPAGLRRLGP